MEATFYTDGWVFGSGVAVKELSHTMRPSGGKPGRAGVDEKALGQIEEQISDQELEQRLASADFVVIAKVTDVRPWTAPDVASVPHRVTEHDPDWHEAVVEVQSVLKGGKVKGNKIVVRFPQRNDVAWAHSPRFEKNQRGIFCLNRDQVSGAPTAKLGGNQVNAYTCLGHGDALPMADEARVRSLLKSQ
jgi:hypothetical protein